ncbi:hypothetical protein AB0O20_06770 [Streptomyces kronopolitis]|uniref:hypothetical protein n=1 Tax=Streptomyces kronopolitis TaxID=1612435 RepID=UPI00343B9196
MTLIPIFHGSGSRRAASKSDVRAENAKLLDRQLAADDFFARLIADRDDVYAAYEAMAQRAADAETVVVCLDGQVRELEAEVTALRARIANQAAVTVEPAVRDIAPGDEATQPIPCGGYWADPSAWRRRGITDVIPLQLRGPEAA